MATLKDYTALKGLNLGYDSATKNVTVGDKMYTPDQLTGAGLTLNQGRWQGEDTALKTLFDTNQTVVPTPPTNISSTPPAQAPVQAPQQDLSSMITNQLSSLTESQIANLRAKIASATTAQKGIIANAPAQFAPYVDQSEVRKAEELRGILERNANQGDRGGVGRQAALETQLAGNKRLNDLNIAEQKVISDANAEIARLQSEGAFEEASILATNKAEELRLLREEATRLQGYAREDKQIADELARADTEKTQAQEREDFNTKIMANYQDISAFINQLKASGAPQWQIDQAEAAKVQKVIENKLDPKTGLPFPVDNTQAIWDNALTKWNAGIPLTPQEMQVIGATTSVKPVKATGGTSGSKTTVTQDRNYQLDRWEILGVADQAIADAWGVPVGTPVSRKPEEAEPIDTSTYEDYIGTYLTTTDGGVTKLDRNGVALYLVKLYNAGKRDEAAILAANYGIDDATIELAERILGNQGRR